METNFAGIKFEIWNQCSTHISKALSDEYRLRVNISCNGNFQWIWIIIMDNKVNIWKWGHVCLSNMSCVTVHYKEVCNEERLEITNIAA